MNNSAPPTFTNEFYVTLPSNASMQIFNSNKANSFRTQLAAPINLIGKWEVGLAEIQYPRTWNTLNRGENIHYWIDGESERWKLRVVAGQYPSIQSILDTIMRNMNEDAKKNIFFEYNENNRRVHVYLYNNAKVKFESSMMCRLLGFDPKTQITMSGKDNVYHEAVRIPDLSLNKNGIFIYTDICAHTPVGDSIVPLLRIVPIEGQDGDIVTKTYDKPHYLPVSKSHIDIIKIELSDDSGKLIDFEYGKTIVKLHFRPRRLQFL